MSTGPITPQGRAKSAMNAFKHGMRAKKQELLRGDSIAFENRLHQWMAIAEPADDMAEFLLHQNVFMSFEVERARRAHLEGLTSQIENSEDAEIEEVWELGNRLFFDPTAPIELYGAPGVFRSKVRTSWNGRPDDPNDPAALVRKLEASELEVLFSSWILGGPESRNWSHRNSGSHTIGHGHSTAGTTADRCNQGSVGRRDFRGQPCPQSSRGNPLLTTSPSDMTEMDPDQAATFQRAGPIWSAPRTQPSAGNSSSIWSIGTSSTSTRSSLSTRPRPTPTPKRQSTASASTGARKASAFARTT